MNATSEAVKGAPFNLVENVAYANDAVADSQCADDLRRVRSDRHDSLGGPRVRGGLGGGLIV